MSAPRPVLQTLAARLGVLPSYIDVTGRVRPTSDATREALVRALGRPAPDEAAASAALAALEREEAERLVEPVLVWRDWEHAAPALPVNPAALAGARDYRVELRLEDGSRHAGEGAVPGPGAAARVALPLPERPPWGYHEVRLELDGGGSARRATQQLVMAPRTAFQPEEALGAGPAFGIWANLYAVRGPTGWGHGNLGDLATLARLAGERGAAFVGLNPLHAVSNRGLSFSPYSPTSRLFRNVLYLDPERVPELETCASARARLEDPALRRRRAALCDAGRIDHAAVHAALLPVLEELHRCFRRGPEDGPRARAYRAYREAQGRALEDFATWEVLAERQGAPGAPSVAWWTWPEVFRDPRSSAVAGFRRSNAGEVDFRCWLQFELDRQLGEAADAAAAAGCRLGLYQDLAVGASRASADAWLAGPLLVDGATVGAPPDDYAPEGQDWGIPPLDPHRIRDDGYRFFRGLLRAGFAHSGALRLDHAMQLMRLFWIPAGRPGSEGAYVRYRAEELLGVLALESRRHRAAVVAEDLGTVPPELPQMLEDWGLLRSAVLFFTRDDSGAFRPPGHYLPRGLATVGTHDLATLPGFWLGSDLELRRALGLYASEAEWQAVRAARDAERAALLARLRAEGLLPPDGSPDPDALLAAVHGLLDRAPTVLVAASLDDLAGERESVNLPGVPLESHRSWSRRMERPLEELFRSPRLRRALAAFERRAPADRALG